MNIRSNEISLLIVLGLVGITGSAHAQGPALGYAFVGPAGNTLGDRSFAWNVGAGGEVLLRNGVAVGGEVGQLRFPAVGALRSTEASVVSINASRHFPGGDGNDDAGSIPFVTAGLSVLSSGGEGIPVFNVGGGMDRWLTRRAGFRVDVRGQFVPGGLVGLGLRVGIVLR